MPNTTVPPTKTSQRVEYNGLVSYLRKKNEVLKTDAFCLKHLKQI